MFFSFNHICPLSMVMCSSKMVLKKYYQTGKNVAKLSPTDHK